MPIFLNGCILYSLEHIHVKCVPSAFHSFSFGKMFKLVKVSETMLVFYKWDFMPVCKPLNTNFGTRVLLQQILLRFVNRDFKSGPVKPVFWTGSCQNTSLFL